jgi:hypothetical protein
MAHGLNGSSSLRLHQALHGYADGHRQLAISGTLKPRDQKTLLALSDISGPGAQLDEQGYLTGFPLPDSGFFALSRTWPAPEMPRPGCVWTHTLLIDFTDLASLEALSCLGNLFKRPNCSSGFAGYGKIMQLDVSAQPELPNTAKAWTKTVLAALYGKPKSRIVVGRSGPEIEVSVLAIWSQQWPRLRRNFRFCTLAASDRSIEGASFDLQVLPSLDRGPRARFSDVVDAESINVTDDNWLEDALQDLQQPDGYGLRSFFRRLGSDLSLGREAFRPLCLLHRSVRGISQYPEAVHVAVSVLQNEFGTQQARTARGIVAEAALQAVEKLDERSFDFLWSNLGLVGSNVLNAFVSRLARETWRRAPQRLAELADENTKTVVDRALLDLETDDLIAGLKAAPQLVELVLARRPEIVQQSTFWTDMETVDVPFAAAVSRGLQSAAVAALIESGRDDLATAAVRSLGARTVLKVLNGNSKFESDRLRTWLQAATVDEASVADFLINQPCISRQFLYTLAQYMPPDAVSNDRGSDDPWLVAWRNSTGTIDDSSSFFLAAYFLGRALGTKSRSQAELAQLSFEATHIAAASGQLPDEAWRILASRLPWSVFWSEWDRCQRLRAGITDLFVERDLSPSVFAHLTQDDHLFLMLAQRAANSRRGQAYLKRVRQEIRDEQEGRLRFRKQELKKLLGQ